MMEQGERRRSATRRLCLSRPALLLALLSGCGPPAPPAAPAGGGKVIRDGLGREVRAPLPARRIVSLAPSNTEILFAVGAGAELVGRDDHSDFPPAARDLPSVGAAAGKLDRERLLALKPDLVLAAEITGADQVESMERIGLTVFRVPNPTSFDSLYGNIRLLGELSGHARGAEEAAAALEGRVRAVGDRLQGLESRPLVFYELDGTDPQRPWTVGPDTFMDLLIRQAGGRNLGASFQRAFPRVSAEQVIAADPEVIVLGDGRFGVTPESVHGRPGWSDLSAVRSGRVYPFDDDLASRPGPRLVEGLETLARLLHPGRFPS